MNLLDLCRLDEKPNISPQMRKTFAEPDNTPTAYANSLFELSGSALPPGVPWPIHMVDYTRLHVTVKVTLSNSQDTISHARAKELHRVTEFAAILTSAGWWRPPMRKVTTLKECDLWGQFTPLRSCNIWFNQRMGTERKLEWPATLDVPALIHQGWRPTPFREFIIKIHSRCDLSCDYCYMYEMADQSWRSQPRRISTEIAEAVAERIGEHARVHKLQDITLILHGGEPLLAGEQAIWSLVEATRKAVGPEVRVKVGIQTNGVGLTDSYLQLFSELEVRVGVSLDGGPVEHDRHRRFASGRGSHEAVVAGLRRLRQTQYRHLFSGLLCTVDVRNDPIATYEALIGFEPPMIDFLLPHGTWDTPPLGRTPNPRDTPYADWLITIFNRWYHDPCTRVRFFDDIIRLILSGKSRGDAVGLAPSTMVVIETNGALEQADSLKATYEGATATGLHVTRDQFDAALMLPSMAARQIGVQALAAECRSCRIHQVCGGGQYGHRYRSGTGFANPSVYCPDLMRLIDHISEVVRADLSARLRSR